MVWEEQLEGILFFIRDARPSEQNSYRFVPDLYKALGTCSPFHRGLGLARADFWPKGGVLPGGGTPEARHSKVTEAFSRTALLTGPGSMLGGTRGLQRETTLTGCGLWAAPVPFFCLF